LLNRNRRRGAASVATVSLLMFRVLVVPIAGLADEPDPAFSGCKSGDYVCEGAKGTLAIPPDNPNGGHGASASPASGGTVGYVWLGNLQPDNTIAAATVRLQSGKALSDLSQLSPEAILVDVNPVYIRETKPKNNADYFRSIRVVGVLQKDAAAKLMGSPIQYQRPSGQVQLWGQVQVGN
jgi:hypothetical protein